MFIKVHARHQTWFDDKDSVTFIKKRARVSEKKNMFMYILLAFFITIYKTIVIFLQQLWNKHCVHLCFIKFFASKVASIFSFRIWFYFRCILLYLFRCHDFLAFSLFIDVVFFYGFFFVTFICNIPKSVGANL